MVSSVIVPCVYVVFMAENWAIALFKNGMLNSYDAIGRYLTHMSDDFNCFIDALFSNGAIIFIFASKLGIFLVSRWTT